MTSSMLCLRTRSRAAAVSLSRGGSRDDLAGDDQTTVQSCSTARAASSLARRHASSTAGDNLPGSVVPNMRSHIIGVMLAKAAQSVPRACIMHRHIGLSVADAIPQSPRAASWGQKSSPTAPRWFQASATSS